MVCQPLRSRISYWSPTALKRPDRLKQCHWLQFAKCIPGFLHYYTCKTPLILNSNVVYKFICSRDVNVTYMSTSARHLSLRAGEHLNVSRSGKSAIREHIRKCSSCKTQPNNMKQFEIIRKCQTSYEAKIHEALVIKRSNPVLNK